MFRHHLTLFGMIICFVFNMPVHASMLKMSYFLDSYAKRLKNPVDSEHTYNGDFKILLDEALSFTSQFSRSVFDFEVPFPDFIYEKTNVQSSHVPALIFHQFRTQHLKEKTLVNTPFFDVEPINEHMNFSTFGSDEYNINLRNANVIYRTEGIQPSGIAFLNQLTIGQVPEPETYVMLLAGLGLVGFSVKSRTK